MSTDSPNTNNSAPPLCGNGHAEKQSGRADPQSDSSLGAVYSSAQNVLEQCRNMVAALPNATVYTTVSRHVPGSTIGKHVRHLCDHFRLLLEATATSSAEPTGLQPTVSYDGRKQGTAIETDRAAGVEHIDFLLHKLSSMRNISNLQTIRVEALVRADAQHSVALESTFGRELWFCTHHAGDY
ncbi:hypothetical protein THASP1DRAFT_27317 [Thamnocephalis sphaerospora]|uniref:Uncharacterized protein n=1 Tax=Thamnocephalis sphaerospora TaxID=78915 RepID=A0A4P9XWT5_9FUNG|nr:hypothetical protein THASP1DRAFT_27317 [Thamnocephalis sphaerospora]|eukprot:RKP10893.1 hypothetical protein THASP1DRAFT_27317 [Thamnocephalis sphaerospora]